MNLQLTGEQRMLLESAVRWVAERGRPAHGAAPAEPGARWREMAEMGWLGLALPEACGGLGQGIAEACVVAEALGAGPVAEPFLSVALLSGGLLAAAGSDAQRSRWLPGLIEGSTVVATATIERAAANDLSLTATRAARQAAGWVLDGDKSLVPSGQDAQAWVVSARTDDDAIAFFLVERGAVGVTERPFETVDGAGACALQLRGVRLSDEARLPGGSAAVFGEVNDQAMVAACAESVGAMETLVRTTVDYTKQRVQFGKPLSANQVLRHRMADMAVLADEARSLTLAAILALQDPGSGAEARARAVAGARARVGLAARKLAEEAIQLHGGMGVTQELTVGAYLRRQMALDAMFGAPEWHLRRHAAMRKPIAQTTEA